MPAPSPTPLLPGLSVTVRKLVEEFDRIDGLRASNLRLIANYLAAELRNRSRLDVMFVCVHNSRRSQLAQAWAQAASHHFRLDGVRAYSGGSVATALYPEAAAALDRLGFAVEKR